MRVEPTTTLEAVLARLEDDARAFAVGWATVDLDRAAAELAEGLGLAPEAFIAAPDSAFLGARCRVGHGVLSGGRSVVVLEPSTEGRLAGALARRDEGPWVTWLADGPDLALPATDGQPGPFGQERLIRDDSRWGPFHFLVDRAAGTIRS